MESVDLVVCDANLPSETLLAIARKTNALEVPLVAVAISPAKVVRFRPVLPGLDMLFLNQAEARALLETPSETVSELIGQLRDAGLAGAVMTSGNGAAFGWLGEEIAEITPPFVESIGDVTGAGDAMAAGVIHGLLSGEALAETLKMGTASAVITVRSPLATSELLSPETLKTNMALVSDAKILS